MKECRRRAEKNEEEEEVVGGGEGKNKKTRKEAAMVNDRACSDVQFVTKEGDKVWANRATLAAASPLFCAMLTNGVTLDSTSPCVPLPSIPTSALLPILEHLYTGSPSPSLYPLSLSSAPLVLRAARFLLLSSLEQSVISFFADSLHALLSDHSSSISPLDASLYLSQALDVSLPHTHHLLSKLASIISNAPTLGPHVIACLSPEALGFFLEETRIGSLRFDASEYRRLRCVLLWCASTMDTEMTEILCKYLPTDDLQDMRPDWSALLQKFSQFKPNLKTVLKPWLPHLDLFRIHGKILTEVVAPMDIIPHSYIMHVLAFQAHYAKEMILLRWKEQNTSDGMKQHHSMQLCVLDDGHSIKCGLQGTSLSRSLVTQRMPGSMASCLSTPPRFARAELPITQTMHVYEWDFVIERECEFMALGFCSVHGLLEESGATWLGYQPFGWVLYHTGKLFHGSKVGMPYAERFGAGSRVRVHVDMIQSTCRFTINNKAYGIAWKNIPDEIYPAAAFTFPGKVRIEAASDERKRKLVECLNASLSGE